jgi:hypothetical protein
VIDCTENLEGSIPAPGIELEGVSGRPVFGRVLTFGATVPEPWIIVTIAGAGYRIDIAPDTRRDGGDGG